MIKMNKKGGSKIITMYWFVIILIVAGGIFAMVYSFYNHPYDVRELEGEIMINSIADCLSSKGEMESELFDENGFSESFSTYILEKCHINLNVEESLEIDPQYYFKIDFYNASNLNVPVFDISAGDKSLVADCNIQEEKEYMRTARCVEDDFFSFNKDNGDLYLIKIISAIKKTEKNVK